jgi:predicted MFS family arabinose efflux permease
VATVHPAAAGAPPIPRRVLGFLVAEAVSAIGSWATAVVIWGYAAYKYDASAADIALFGIAFTIPGVLFGPVSGTVIDRIGTKPTLALAKVLGIGASLSLVLADDFRTLGLLSALVGIAGAFSLPALQAMPPRVVDSANLARTNALVSLTDELAIIVGPALAGVSIGLVGFKGAFVIDALTYALGLLVLPMVHLHPPVTDAEHEAPADGGEDAPVRFRDTFDGWRLVFATPMLRRIVACTGSVHLLYGAALLAEPLYVRDTLERSEGVFAALQTVFGIFLVAGGLLAARVGDRMASFRWVAVGVAASGVTAIIYLGTPFVAVAFGGVALWGVATALISGPSRTVLQRATPGRAHGRVLSADFVTANLAEMIGVALGGLAVGAVGVPPTFIVLGLGVFVVATLLIRADSRDTTEVPPAPAMAAAEPAPVG